MFIIIQGLKSDDYITQGYGVAVEVAPSVGWRRPKVRKRKEPKKLEKPQFITGTVHTETALPVTESYGNVLNPIVGVVESTTQFAKSQSRGKHTAESIALAVMAASSNTLTQRKIC